MMASDAVGLPGSQPPGPEPPRGPARVYVYPLHKNGRLVDGLARGVVARGGVRAARWLTREVDKIAATLSAAGISKRQISFTTMHLAAAVGLRLQHLERDVEGRQNS